MKEDGHFILQEQCPKEPAQSGCVMLRELPGLVFELPVTCPCPWGIQVLNFILTHLSQEAFFFFPEHSRLLQDQEEERLLLGCVLLGFVLGCILEFL